MKLTSFIIALHFSYIHAVQKCEKDVYTTKYFSGTEERKILVLWFPVDTGSVHTLSLCSGSSGLPLQRYCHYDRTSQTGKWQDIHGSKQLVNCSIIDSKCKEQQFDHYYISRNSILTKFNNKWKQVNIMETAGLQEPCLLASGLAVTRRCLYNSKEHAAQWEPLGNELKNISCIRDVREKVITFQLNTIHQNIIDNKEEYVNKPKKAINEMLDLFIKPKTVHLPADIKISTDILQIITEEYKNESIVTEILNITNIIMDTKPEILQNSNSSSLCLKIIDRYFDRMAKNMVPTSQCQNNSNSPNGVYQNTYKLASLFYINPSCSNISGVAIYNSANTLYLQKHYHYDKNTKNYYRFLYLNQTVDELLAETDLRVAAFFPQSLWKNLTDNTAAVNNETVLKILIFQNDRFFTNQAVLNLKPTKKVLEISIPNYHGDLPGELPFIFNYSSTYKNSKRKPVCGYWNYSRWIDTGINTIYINNTNHKLLLCYSSHLTHFAALVGIKYTPHLSLLKSTTLHVIHDVILDYISIAGCSLSLFGLICVWLSAIFLKKWSFSTKVLLNMCFVLTLVMALFLLLNFPAARDQIFDIQNSIHCMIMGGLLQYIILVLFTWMLIIAVMQYQCCVCVFPVDRPKQCVRKFALISWGVPLIPTCLVAYFDPESYMPIEAEIDNSAICYPSGNSLYYGVLLPLAVVIIANLCIFAIIIWSVHNSSKTFNHQIDRKSTITQLRLSVFLFFLLGLSWIFGMMAHLETSPVFSYIFCLTSTLQGFVLFIYFIIIEKTTRYWTINKKATIKKRIKI